MIYNANEPIIGIYLSDIPIIRVYFSDQLVWELEETEPVVFLGIWIDSEIWNDNDIWRE